MRFAAWVFARSTAYRWSLFFLFLLASVVTGTLTGMSGYVASSTAAGIQTTLADAAPQARVAQLRTGLASDPAAQAAAAQALFDRVFQVGSVQLDRTVSGGPFKVEKPATARPVQLAVRVLPQIATHTVVVSGRWPAAAPAVGGEVQLAVLADSAAVLHIRTGDEVKVAANTVVAGHVAAILRPIEPGDPYLFSGEADATAVVASTVPFTNSPQVSWTISPSRAIGADRIGPLQGALAGLQATVNNDIKVNTGTVSQTGELATTLAVLGASLAAAKSVAPLPVLLVAGLGLLLVVVASSLLAGLRRPETALLHSRGVAAGPIVLAAAVESVLVSSVGAAAGIVLAWLVTSISAATAVLWAGLVVLTSVSAAVVPVFRHSRLMAFGSGRFRWVVVAGPAVLLLVTASLALLRFRHLGSVVVVDGSGVARVDPVAVAAAPLGLLVMAMAGAAVVGLGLRVVAGPLRRSAGVLFLPAAEISRRWPAFGTVTLLMGLAVAGTATAATFDRTWNDFRQAVAHLDNVTDVRVAGLMTPDISIGMADPASRFGASPSIATATNALVTSTEAGDQTIELMAAPAARMAAVLPSIAGAFDASAAARELSGGGRGPEIPQGATGLDLGLDVSASVLPAPDQPVRKGVVPVEFSFVAWFTGPQGVLLPVKVGQLALRVPVDAAAGSDPSARTRKEILADIPTHGATGWRMVALDTIVAADDTLVLSVDVWSASVRRSPTRPSTALPFAGGQIWAVQPTDDTVAGLNLTGRAGRSIGFGGAVPAGIPATTVRLMPDPPRSVPIVVSDATAALLGLGVGDPLELQLSGTSRHIRATVAAVVPLLPGGRDGPRVLADLSAVSTQLLADTTSVPAPNQVWLQSASPQAAAAQARAVVDQSSVVTQVGSGTSAALVRPVATAFWVAAISCLLFAVLALGTLAMTMARQRRSEVLTLRAVGLLAGQQVVLRCGELTVTSLAAAGIGALAARANAWLTVGDLARSAVIGGSRVTPTPVMAPVGWLVLGAGAIGAAMTIGGYGLVLARQADGRRIPDAVR